MYCEFLQCELCDSYSVMIYSGCNRNTFLSVQRFVADNRIDCNAAYLSILCRGYLARDGATCIDYDVSQYDTELLDSVCDGELPDYKAAYCMTVVIITCRLCYYSLLSSSSY